MCRKLIVGVCVLLCSVAARSAHAQTWSSADVGNTAIAGSATQAGETWTVSASGDDIWSTADAFHFLYRFAPVIGSVVARVDDLQNTNPFAKAGVMVRDGLDPAAATVILDVKPDGFIELMEREPAHAAMNYRGGRQA